MGTDLTRIGEKARKDPELVFTSLYHHITDIDNLRASYDKLLAHKASGIDGVLALFTVGDVYASPCKRGAYAPFSAQRRLRALFWL